MAEGSGDQRESSTARQRGDGRPRPPLVHSNTEYYIKHTNSPETNRKNAGLLLRRMSDDFNSRKFPHLIREHSDLRRVASHPGAAGGQGRRWSVAVGALHLLRRVSGFTGIGESSGRPRREE